MRDFITCLEFLTRIRFSNRTLWKDEDFSRSVPYFPIIGMIIGAFLGGLNWLCLYIDLPIFMRATLLILGEVIITGGLMYDGFMDTADGVFSARNRERMLEIMKDSHVGANAVLAIILLILLKMSVYLSVEGSILTILLFTMSIATRTFMVLYIVNFPYARKTGIGHMFKKYAKPVYTFIALVIGLVTISWCGLLYLSTAFTCLTLSLVTAYYFSKQLGGLTGDTYGALTECGNVYFLFAFIFMNRLGW